MMTSNLRLGDSTDMTLTPDDTATNANFTLPAVQTSGSDSWYDHNVSDYPNNPQTAQDRDSNHVYATGNESYGNYYTSYTATAGSGGSITTRYANASYSICPKGWRLPQTYNGSSTKTEFNDLNISYNNGSTSTDSGLIASPLSFVRSGRYYNGVGGQGDDGGYWSSTVSSARFAYYLDFSSDYVDPANYYSRDGGFAVRCVLAQ